MMIEYKLVKATELDIESTVNALFAEGWQPFGPPYYLARGLSAKCLEVFQAMVKYAPEVEPPIP